MALLDHAGDNCLGHDEGRIQVHVNYLSELGRRHIAHGNPLDDSCIVDQDVNHAHFLLNGGNHPVHSILIRHVTYISVGFNPLFLVSSKAFINQFLLNIIEYNGCPCACHGLCNGKTDSIRRACNQRNLAI